MLISASRFDCAEDPLSTLAAGLRALLPVTAPAAPWTCRCDIVMWAMPIGHATTALVPAALRRGASRLYAIGGFVTYHRSPVGPHRTVFAGIAVPRRLSPTVHVRLSASDSPSSSVGLRANWGIPGTLATFDNDSNNRLTADSLGGTPWSISATVLPIRCLPSMPVHATPVIEQLAVAGSRRRAPLSIRGRLQPVLVDTAVSSATSIAQWLRPGRHYGIRSTGAALHWLAPGRPAHELTDNDELSPTE